MCIRNSRATNPTRMPAPLASESSRILRDPAAGGRIVLGPRRRSRVRFQNLPELARPPPAETGLRRFLARRGGGPRSAGREVAQLAVEIIRVWDRGAMLHGHAAKYACRYRTNEPDDAGRQVRRAALSGLCREALRSALS